MTKHYYDTCLECNKIITYEINNYSIKEYGIPLCLDCQKWLNNMLNKSTPFAIRLYFDLKMQGIPAELEKFDGHKHIDIIVECAKLHIEVDGSHHNTDEKQALADLKRTYYSYKKGYYTIRIPNTLTVNNLLNTSNYITEIINLRMEELEKQNRVGFRLPKNYNNRY